MIYLLIGLAIPIIWNVMVRKVKTEAEEKLQDYMEFVDYVVQVTKLYDIAYTKIFECLLDDAMSKDEVLEVVVQELGFIEVVYEGDEDNEYWDLMLATVDLEDDE